MSDNGKPEKPDNRLHKVPRYGRPQQPNGPRKVAIDLRNQDLLKMRATGATIAQIGRHFGLDHTTVSKAITKQVAKVGGALAESREVVFHMLIEQLDSLTRTWHPLAHGQKDKDGEWITEPDQGAAEFMLGIIDRRAKLYGLNAPVKVDVNVQVQVSQIAEAQTGAFPLVMERLEREGLTGEQLELAARAIAMFQEVTGEGLKRLDDKPVETEFTEVKGNGG